MTKVQMLQINSSSSFPSMAISESTCAHRSSMVSSSVLDPLALLPPELLTGVGTAGNAAPPLLELLGPATQRTAKYINVKTPPNIH